MEDEQHRVPVVVGEQPVESGEDAVEQLADRLAAEEALLVRHDTAERVHERGLELSGSDRREPVAADLAQLGPLLDACPGATSAAVSIVRGRPLAITRSNAIPASRSRAASACATALVGQRHRVGWHRVTRVVEVRDRAVTHEVDPAAHAASGHR